MGVAKLSITFILQMALIPATCRIIGWRGQKYLKQPQVGCEMIAGVLLGPSLFSLVAPDLQVYGKQARTSGGWVNCRRLHS